MKPKSSSKYKPARLFICMAFFGLILYSNMIWTSGLEADQSTTNGTIQVQCVTLEKWFDFIRVFALVDSIITIVIPFMVISTMNLLIASKLMKLYKQGRFLSYREREQKTALTSNNNSTLIISLKSQHLKVKNTNTTFPYEMSRLSDHPSVPVVADTRHRHRKLKKYIRSTMILLIISAVFLVLNTPIAFCKMRYSYQFIKLIINKKYFPESTNTSDYSSENSLHPLEETLERISCYMYYMNFSTNFLFYFFGFKRVKN